MKRLLALAGLLSVVVLITGTANLLGSGVPSTVHYVDHDKASAVMQKGGDIANDPGFVVQANRRDTVGRAEYHDHTAHVFIIVDGEATLVVGGTMVNPERTAPDQLRSASVEGGQSYHMSKGDVITIPAKVPHWWKEVSTKTIGYYAVNIDTN
jgi:mannose-6-phosphate isomerase-like protein (cupin superfamily)